MSKRAYPLISRHRIGTIEIDHLGQVDSGRQTIAAGWQLVQDSRLNDRIHSEHSALSGCQRIRKTGAG